MNELCPELGEGFPVPPDELFEEWEAEVAHTTLDETWHVAKRAAEWGYRQCWNTWVAIATGVEANP